MAKINIFRILDMSFVIEENGILFKRYFLDVTAPMMITSIEKNIIMCILAKYPASEQKGRHFRRKRAAVLINEHSDPFHMHIPIKGKKNVNQLLNLLEECKTVSMQLATLC